MDAGQPADFLTGMCLYLTSLGLKKQPSVVKRTMSCWKRHCRPYCQNRTQLRDRSKRYNWTWRCDRRRGLYQAQHSVEGSQNQATLMDGLLYHRMELYGGAVGQNGECVCAWRRRHSQR